MLEFPREMRDLIVESLDEYADDAEEAMSASELAEVVAETFVSTAEECGLDDTEGLLNKLAESAELETPLLEALTSLFAAMVVDGVLGEELVEAVEELCDLDWTDSQDGFGVAFDAGDESDEDDEF